VKLVLQLAGLVRRPFFVTRRSKLTDWPLYIDHLYTDTGFFFPTPYILCAWYVPSLKCNIVAAESIVNELLMFFDIFANMT